MGDLLIGGDCALLGGCCCTCLFGLQWVGDLLCCDCWLGLLLTVLGLLIVL